MATSEPRSFRVVIVGAGIAGLGVAIGLRRKGHHVTVLERTAVLQAMGGSVTIPPNAARVLDSYGIWDRFQTVEDDLISHTTYNYRGKLLERISIAAMEKVFGYGMRAISRALYQQILYEAAIKEGVEVRLGIRIDNIDEKIPLVRLSNGENIEAEIIIGADGIHSMVRRAVLGKRDVQPVYESTAFNCLVSSESMRNSHLTSSLMEGGPLHTWWGPGRHLICGPKNLGTAYSITLFVHFDQIGKPLNPKQDSALNSSKANRLGDVSVMRDNVKMFEPKVRKFVEMVKPENCNLWKVAYLPDLDTWVSPSGRVVLLGDAAHAMTPHLGQGAATGIEDGGVLIECLNQATSTDNIANALHTYERIQKPRVERIKEVAKINGVSQSRADGPEQRKRDEKAEGRMNPSSPKYEFWKAGGILDWVYAYDFKQATRKELNKTVDKELEVLVRSRI